MFNKKFPKKSEIQKEKDKLGTTHLIGYRRYVEQMTQFITTKTDISQLYKAEDDIGTKKALFYVYNFCPVFMGSILIDYTFDTIEPNDFIVEGIKKFENSFEIFNNNGGNDSFNGAINKVISYLKGRQSSLKHRLELQKKSVEQIQDGERQQTKFTAGVKPQIRTNKGGKYVYELEHKKPKEKTPEKSM